jgi:hypothetical protein
VIRSRSALVAAAGALCIGACGSAQNKPSQTTHTTHRAVAPLGARFTAASRFAGAYVRFLDGAGAARGLPDATASVRALAEQAGPIPATRRRGTLVLVQLRLALGERGSYLLSASDRAHTFYAELTVAPYAGHWLVVALTPPDFVQVLAAAGPGPPRSPLASRPAELVARRFLRGYLPWLYDRARLRTAGTAGTDLQRRLSTRAPRVPTTLQRLSPRLVALAIQHDHGGWQALANITDGSETYELALTVTNLRGQWLVDRVSSPR